MPMDAYVMVGRGLSKNPQNHAYVIYGYPKNEWGKRGMGVSL